MNKSAMRFAEKHISSHHKFKQVQSSSWDGRPFRHNRHGPKIGVCAHLGKGWAGSPCNTMSPGPRPTSVPSGILILSAVWPQQTWSENWGELCPFGKGELDPHLTQFGRGRGLPPCQALSCLIQPFGHNTPTSETDRQTERHDRQTTDR